LHAVLTRLNREHVTCAQVCPICLDPVTEGKGRSTATLACAHRYHLSCIGSAFNAKVSSVGSRVAHI
jgi:hypothetical protein